MNEHAIYLADGYGTSVLLKDGAWTAPGNCYLDSDKAAYGMYLHEPKLFETRRAALDWRRARLAKDRRVYVARWVYSTAQNASEVSK